MIFFFLVLLFHQHHGCYGRQTKINNNSSCISSCGNIHNISYPFRLTTDPKNCGDKNYELVCENNLTPVVYFDSAKYNVQSINYRDFTIQIIDSLFRKDNCSTFPYYSPNRYQFYSEFDYYYYYFNRPVTLVNCKDRTLNSIVYVGTYPCINNTYDSGHWYVKLDYTPVTELVDSCRIEKIAEAPSSMVEDLMKKKNISYMDVHGILTFGIQLSWFSACCGDNYKEINGCNLDYLNLAKCSRYVYAGGSVLQSAVEDLLDALRHFGGIGRLYGAAHYIFEELNGWSIRDAPYYALGLLPYLIAVLVLYRATLTFCGAICLISFLFYKWRRRHLSIYDNIEEFLQSYDNLLPIRYSYRDIKKISRGFKEKLGEGGYGSVYKGKLRSGSFAAIKMLSMSKSNGQDFINEVATIGRIHHANIVRLVGFCAEKSKRALVYEFMPNGSLDKYIFSQEGNVMINIKSLYEISLGVAYGIEYLHRGCNMQILHFDIKPHNILLDEKFNPKISDFGLAKLYSTDNSIVTLTAARGTLGYMAPELVYKSIGGISYKADVYSFGILLMEMVGRRKSLNAFAEHSSQIYFPSWVYEQFNKGSDIEIGDVSDEERKIANKMVLAALWCIQLEPKDRPSMHKVIQMLEGDLESLELPPKPSLIPKDKSNENVAININPISSTNAPGTS